MLLFLLLLFSFILSDNVRSVVFSHDKKWVASGSDDKSVRLWCIEDSSKNQILQGHTSMYRRTYVFLRSSLATSSVVLHTEEASELPLSAIGSIN